MSRFGGSKARSTFSGIAFALMVAVAALVTGAIVATNSTPVGAQAFVSRIAPSTPKVTISANGSVVLSLNVYGLQNVKNADLAAGATLDWSATGGSLSVDKGGASAVYTAPATAGREEVTVIASSGCAGETADCTAKFTVTVRKPSEVKSPDAPAQNPEGEIPAVITDADGQQYEVFTPEEGGTFSGDGFSVTAPVSAIPNLTIVGIRMSDSGPASNAGMTHHRYTLDGRRYTIYAVSSEGEPVSSFQLDEPLETCIPVPGNQLSAITDVGVIGINAGDALTAYSSGVRIGPDLAVCGKLSMLPATIAAGVPGAPAPLPTATPEPPPELPVTGGGAAESGWIYLWALLLGAAVFGFGAFAVKFGRPRA